MLEALSKDINSLSNNRKSRCLRQFADKVEARGLITSSQLSGCKLCFSSAFEKDHMKDALVLIQLLANHQCRYNTKVSENDYYVATKEELDLTDILEHTRYHLALHNAETGCKVISFDELYKMLEEYQNFDLLIGVEESNIRNMLRFYGGDPKHKIKKLLSYTKKGGDIADPWYTDEFSVTYNEILYGCTELLKTF